jgi:chromosome segregation ATPase
MVEVLSAIVGSLVTLITTVSIAWAKIKAIKVAHEEKLMELQTAKEVALADANAKIKDAEDRRQNEAFDRLSKAFDAQVQLYTDLLSRTQKLEDEYASLKAEHANCNTALAEVRAELSAMKKG